MCGLVESIPNSAIIWPSSHVKEVHMNSVILNCQLLYTIVDPDRGYVLGYELFVTEPSWR